MLVFDSGSCWRLITIVMQYSGSDVGPLNGVHSQAVVPVTSCHKVLIIKREDKEFVRDFKIMGKRSTHVVPF